MNSTVEQKQTIAELVYKIPTRDALELFMISREGMGVTPKTLHVYSYGLNRFVNYLESQGKYGLADITDTIIYEFFNVVRTNADNFASKASGYGNHNKRSDRYVHMYAREIKTFLRYCEAKDLMLKYPRFIMPKVRRVQLRVLTVNEVKEVIKVCPGTREQALILFLVDSGLRLFEVISMNWGDIERRTGKIHVIGKGEKYRPVAIGKNTIKTLLRYRIELQAMDPERVDDKRPVFQTNFGERFTEEGMRSLIVRLSKHSGTRFSTHALRRTFAKLALRAGMDITVIQQQMGHADVETTRNYVQQLDDDFITDQVAAHGVVDTLIKPRH